MTPSTVIHCIQQEAATCAITPAVAQRWLSVLLELHRNVQVQRKPKIPKGTRDLLPDQMAIREMAFRT